MFQSAVRGAVTRTLDGPVPVFATVAAKGGGFIARVKARPDVEIVAVTVENRDRLPHESAAHILARYSATPRSRQKRGRGLDLANSYGGFIATGY